MIKTETCAFSGLRIYPGHGKRMVRIDGRLHIFLSKKAERGHKLRRNPREVTWTVLYRRMHKKGVQAEEITKRRTRRVVKHHRAVGNTTVEALLAKRNQKPEFRRTQREAAVKAAKEKTKAVKTAAKVEKQKQAQKAQQKTAQKAAKSAPSKGAGRVGGKR